MSDTTTTTEGKSEALTAKKLLDAIYWCKSREPEPVAIAVRRNYFNEFQSQLTVTKAMGMIFGLPVFIKDGGEPFEFLFSSVSK